jgi:hypothetical protein
MQRLIVARLIPTKVQGKVGMVGGYPDRPGRSAIALIDDQKGWW